MSAAWTSAMVLALAPDPASAKAGEGLAATRKWMNLGSGEGLIWGECQGSGANPYQTKVDVAGPAFSCSCPSRKFPCKHGLGLMLAWVASPTAFVAGAPPAWVASWKENREKKAEQAKAKVEQGPAPVDLAAQEKREAARQSKVAAGLDDLALWTADIVRQGFAALGAKSGKLWDEQARRMVDAQAPGVARRLRQIDALSMAGEGWQADLLDRLARLHLLGEGFRRQQELPPAVADDVRATLGFPIDLNVVRAGPGVRDRWQVLGHSIAVEDRLTVRRTWLIGCETNLPALLLDFAAGGKPLEQALPPGVVIDADLAFFPGATPLRALIKERHGEPAPLEQPTGGTTITAAFETYGAALAQNPWLELYPIVLNDVVLQADDAGWSARDPDGNLVPLSKRFSAGWHMLALARGGPLTLCGEFDGATLDPFGCFAGDCYLPLLNADAAPLETVSVAPPVLVPLFVEATASALVGLERRPPPSPLADDPIGLSLSGLETKEPAARLLAVAAASSLYGRVGRKPARTEAPMPPVCPADDQAVCLPAQASRLRRLLNGEHAECLPEWIELLATSERRLPDAALVDLLKWSETHGENTDSFDKILGVTGHWLASLNPKWRKHAGVVDDADPAVVWETGTLPQRVAALRSLRASDPSRARELVASTFATDPADQRAAFVAEFARGLSMDDEPFLEATLDDRGKDVRRNASDCLRGLPESRLCLRMIERARAALQWENGTLVVTPPTACDKAMIRDGVDPKPPPYMQLGERAWWLRELMSAVPTRSLAVLLGATPEALVAASRAGDWESSLTPSWTVSALRHRDVTWAEPLLEAVLGKEHPLWNPGHVFRLLALFAPDQREAFLLQRLCADDGPLKTGHPAFGFVQSLKQTVSATVAREILQRVRPIIEEERAEFAEPRDRVRMNGQGFDHKYHNLQTWIMIDGLSALLPLESVDEDLADLSNDADPPPYYRAAYQAMRDRLRFRRDMHREFAS
jgi:Family of unknown function (DUF5691)/SWIM zinc finger